MFTKLGSLQGEEGAMPQIAKQRFSECIETLQVILSGANKINYDHIILADLGYLLSVLGANKRVFVQILEEDQNKHNKDAEQAKIKAVS